MSVFQILKLKAGRCQLSGIRKQISSQPGGAGRTRRAAPQLHRLSGTRGAQCGRHHPLQPRPRARGELGGVGGGGGAI